MGKTLINVVENHLMKYREISSKEAFSKYGVTRLSAIIYFLRLKGYPIDTEIREGVNRYGNKVRYGVYKLPKKWKPKKSK